MYNKAKIYSWKSRTFSTQNFVELWCIYKKKLTPTWQLATLHGVAVTQQAKSFKNA